jgi:hypothetical protein
MGIRLKKRIAGEFDLKDCEFIALIGSVDGNRVSAAIRLSDWKTLYPWELSQDQRLTELLKTFWSQILQRIVQLASPPFCETLGKKSEIHNGLMARSVHHCTGIEQGSTVL